MDLEDADNLLGVVGAIDALDLSRKRGGRVDQMVVGRKLIDGFSEGAIFNATIFNNPLLMLDKEGAKAGTWKIFT